MNNEGILRLAAAMLNLRVDTLSDASPFVVVVDVATYDNLMSGLLSGGVAERDTNVERFSGFTRCPGFVVTVRP